MSDPFGADAVSRWLGALGIEFAAPLQFQRIGLGQSNLTYRVTDSAGRAWVLRRPPLGHLLASAHDVVREARIIAALADTDVPVPAILGVTTDSEFSDVPLVLMERNASRKDARETWSMPHVRMPAKWGSAGGLVLGADAGSDVG